jgi:cell division protein FtsI/penicillin-binding protein 2
MIRSFTLVVLTALTVAAVEAPAAKRPAVRPAPAAQKTSAASQKKSAATVKAKAQTQQSAAKKPAPKAVPVNTASRRAPVRKARSYRQRWMEPTYADSTIGDRVEGEDLTVRRAAVEALGPLNGSVVVADASNGRVLSIVNQRVAFEAGYTPCSTVKLVTSIAGLVEGVITPQTQFRVARRQYMNLTEALARSNNPYFSTIGRQLGFERIAYYARLFGFGEKAGLNIHEEKAGLVPEQEQHHLGGVGLMTSHGMGINLTPLQLASLLVTMANDGTMYWLQYPRSREDAEAFTPQVKRQLDLASIVDQMRPGMEGAVEWGSGRRAREAADDSTPIFGKTGTCTHSDQRTHLGWFGSYNQVGDRKLVVVVLLTGGRPVNGPVASGVAGSVYRILAGQNYYAQAAPAASAEMTQ